MKTRLDCLIGCFIAITGAVCPSVARGDTARIVLAVDYDAGLGSAGSWQLLGRVEDSGDGANGDFGLSAVRFFLTDIDFGTAGEAILLAPDIGALDPLNAGQPDERPPAVLRGDGVIDLIYVQDLSSDTIVFEVGASADALLATGTFSAGMSPGFGRDSNAPNAATTQALFLPASSTPIVSPALLADRTLTRVIDNVSVLGDYTGDGLVNAADYTAWRDNEGSTIDLAPDGDGDQIVDDDDYLVWVESYASTSNPQATPEPTAWLLATIGMASVAIRQRSAKS